MYVLIVLLQNSIYMEHKFAYFFLRLPIAMSLLGHGLVRLPKLTVFSNWMVDFMQESWIPASLILGFSYAVPFVEVILGIFLLLGLFTRQTLYGSLLLMSIFIFGNCTIEKWDAVSVQLIHAVYFALLLFLIRYNYFSIDHKIKKQ